jgi:TIR domain
MSVISYRREDSASEAGRICSAIHQEFGEDSVFLDTSSIQAGAKWPEEIQSALKAAETIIVVIGPEWLRVGSNEWGQRRIDQENDWVRQELSLALKENKSVVPVLVRGARMPPADALPECINTLPHRQKLDIRNDYWDHDIELLLVRLPRPSSKQQEANNSKLGPYLRNSPAGPAPLGEDKLRKEQQIAAFAFGIVFVVALLTLAILFPAPTPFQYMVFKVVLSLAAAGMAAMIPGFLTVTISGMLQAGGALAVFAVVYFFNPASLVVPPPDAVPEKMSIHAERYTNLRRLGERLLADYLLVKLHPDGSFDIIQSKTPGLNLVIPESVLFQIQGKWVVEESEITQNPNRVRFRFSKVAEFNGRVLLQVDF